MLDKTNSVFDLTPDMQDIGTDIMDEVLKQRNEYEPENFSKDDVLNALNARNFTIQNFKALLSPQAEPFLEDMAQKARAITRANFGLNINFFTPIYIANHCDNNCVYCGFSLKNKIKRAKLSDDELRNELSIIAKTGLREILILTGESDKESGVSFIANAAKIASEYFRVVGVEIQPLNSDEYEILHANGVDYVTCYQETYEPNKYSRVHLQGKKRSFKYRFNTQERALMGGMRGVAFGGLLGLDDFRKDAFATGLHAELIRKKYPQAEISLSVPRLRPIINNNKINPRDVTERKLLQVLCAYRLMFPTANITISTRENARFRDNVIQIACNKMSAGVNTGVGGLETGEKKGDEQFEISDPRSVSQIFTAVKNTGLEPLMSEYIYL
ncbi:2-iminoacetate synthase ThiH [Campylobacter majalis]|uniref:2-iminoacetate synthase ThiH n=1 Tax=Campylobacter majalis TaxID=2790656 RepID=UPI003D68CEDE